jgi:hypothetical protein
LAPVSPLLVSPSAHLSPAQRDGVEDGFEEDDDVEPEGLVLDVVEVVLELESGVLLG